MGDSDIVKIHLFLRRFSEVYLRHAVLLLIYLAFFMLTLGPATLSYYKKTGVRLS